MQKLGLAVFGRHQASALAATALDFGVMIAAVEILRAGAVPATVCGALCGATLNFTLARRWTFRATAGSARAQSARYALVSAGSVALNAVGEHLLLRLGVLPYVAARVVTAAAVSFGWNLPLQRSFVFR